MNKWELARYLIDAKKNVDSIIYMAENLTAITNINVRSKIYTIRQSFYINCCIVLDKSFPKKKKKLCLSDDIINAIYYERDKNGAHKDEDYVAPQFDSLKDMAHKMKKQIIHVRDICAEYIPDKVTLDFVPHDRELFRLVHMVNYDAEEKINRLKYPLYNAIAEGKDGIIKKIFDDTEDIRLIKKDDISEYAIILENGINIYEALQNRQDMCIKMNVLYERDVWCTINSEEFVQFEKWMRLGLINEYGMPVKPDTNNYQAWDELRRFYAESGEINE